MTAAEVKSSPILSPTELRRLYAVCGRLGVLLIPDLSGLPSTEDIQAVGASLPEYVILGYREMK